MTLPLISLGLLFCCAACLAAPPRWTVLGPGGGGAQYLPTISPHDPKQVLVACDMTGAYVTHDAGASWRMFNLRGRVQFFVFDPLAPNVIYAGTGAVGLWCSRDNGRTWALVYPDSAVVTGVSQVGDHAETRLNTTQADSGTITSLAIDPANSQILYAAIQQAGGSYLAISPDGGATWNRSADLPEGGRHLYVDARSPQQDRTLIVVGAHSIFIREGGQWQQGQPPAGNGFLQDASLGFPANGEKPVVYALSGGRPSVSEDGGRTWRESSLPGENARCIAIATSLNHPDVAYVSYHRLELDGKEWFGVARTGDRGHTWELAWQEGETNTASAPNIHDAWITERFGPEWGGFPLNLGVAPQDPNLCYATDLGRTLRTTDGGKTWQALYSKRLPDGSYTSTGLDVTTTYGVHFDPFDPKRIFITYTDIGLFRSENGGQGWVSSTQGVPHRWVNTTYWVVFDPTVKGRMWAAMSGTHDLPRPKMWRRQDPANYHGGVCRSDDGGKTWQTSNEGMPETAVTHVLLDPHSPSNARVLYTTAFGRGVYKSVDDGKTWALKNTGLEGAEPFAWRLVEDAKGILYLVVARRNEEGDVGNGDGALYRSEDGAEHWTKIPLPPGVNGPNGLAVDPIDPNRLYLAAWARIEQGRSVDGGIYLSTDRGQTWKNVLSQDPHIYDVTIDPHHPKLLYACGFGSSVWRSQDQGATWQRVRGYNFKWGHRVIVDPADPGKIYVTTFGGSVWHGPAAGDANAVEDITAPPALTYSMAPSITPP